ncbi:predicted protein [Uncinocarpus reesii 1704]|uniref:Uncharacterized protein n=1 Tax=Uncinocarpus reesii (strain UAMH 1704) TaxID=336963 RepID=C4JNK9_UNCRE|nr:uncharacterized protein UREG_03007 [Uncinocarpus reesii 1704]EEP78162.1 predicted protein [Uncinocarpus reesii 1704]
MGQTSLPQTPHNHNIHNGAGAFVQPPAMTTPSASRPPFTTPTRPAQLPGQMQAQTPPVPHQLQSSPSPHPPQPTPAAQAAQAAQAAVSAREKARVTVLLDINSALLQEVVNLQSSGKTGVSNQPATTPAQDQQTTASPTEPSASQSQGSGSQPAKPATKSTQEYVDCMRRLQANLAYLATVADRAKKTGVAAPLAPAILTPPPSMPSLIAAYTQLNELFPDAAKLAAHAQAQQRQMPTQNIPQLMPQTSQPTHISDGMVPGTTGAMNG